YAVSEGVIQPGGLYNSNLATSTLGGDNLPRENRCKMNRASRQSATGGEQRRVQSALYQRQRRRRLYPQNAARASWEFRGSHGRGRRERVRGGGGRAA